MKVVKVERFYTHCDKCGKPVPNDNDAVVLEAIAGGDWTLYFAQPRHLIPTDKCPGSPSRAQYLEGQPRDTRPTYPYNEKLEPVYRAAYAAMQLVAAENI